MFTRIISAARSFLNLDDSTMIPLSDKSGYYNGVQARLGTSNKKWRNRPDIKNPIIAFVGASVPKQIAEEVIKINNTSVKIVNLCIPAQDINEWNNPRSKVWTEAAKTLAFQGLNWEDITVVWTMQDDLRDGGDQRFPEAPQSLEAKLSTLIGIIKLKFPNVKQIDLASRTYSYDTGSKHGEPSCYHTGWANKWLVEDFRKDSVYIVDRCYLWTNGISPRNDEAYTPISHYNIAGDDLVHYSKEGQEYWGNFVFNYYKQFNWFK